MLKEIKNRHSIRRYTNQEVSINSLEKLIKAGMQAPSAMNEQPWHFVVVDDKKVLKQMSKTTPHQAMLSKASAAIVVLGNTRISRKEYCYVDCAAAIENILLEATHLGIGTCWCAIAPNMDKVKIYRELFGIKNYLLPIAVISIGYPNEKKDFIDRYDESKVTWI